MNPQSNNQLRQRLIATWLKIGHPLDVGADWLGDRVEDLAKWLANLVRYLPVRVGRLILGLWFILVGVILFLPVGVRVWRRGGRTNFAAWLRARARWGALRVVQFVLQALDVIGVPELFALLWRAATRATPLTGAEIAAVASVLGPYALRYQDIRVAQRGILGPIFRVNGGRAFTTFHTVNVPTTGDHQRSNVDILLHELVHVYQYERAGSRYFAGALLAQREEGYGYGGEDGLRRAHADGKRMCDFNREQQAQIAQDYFMYCRHGAEAEAYEPFIAELREGQV